MPEVNGEISKKLSCSFSNGTDLKTTLIINDPVDKLDSETVSAAMETIVDSNASYCEKRSVLYFDKGTDCGACANSSIVSCFIESTADGIWL